jgi:hypothetical protein
LYNVIDQVIIGFVCNQQPGTIHIVEALVEPNHTYFEEQLDFEIDSVVTLGISNYLSAKSPGWKLSNLSLNCN